MVSEADIFIRILQLRNNTPDYASSSNRVGRSSVFVTENDDENAVKNTLRQMKRTGYLDYRENQIGGQGVPGTSGYTPPPFTGLYLTEKGEEALIAYKSIATPPSD